MILGAGIEQRLILGADGQRQIILQRVKENKIAQDVATHRKQERMAAAFKALEKIRPAEADEPFAGAGQIVHDFGLLLRRRHVERWFEIIGEAVAWQIQHPDGIHYFIRIQFCVLVVRVVIANTKRERLGLALGKMETVSAFKNQKPAVFLGLGLIALGTFFLRGQQHGTAFGAFRESVVAFDETARAANHEQAHEFAPVVGMITFFKRIQAIDDTLMAACKFVGPTIAITAQVFFRPDANYIVGIQEQTKLIGEIIVGFVVGRG